MDTVKIIVPQDVAFALRSTAWGSVEVPLRPILDALDAEDRAALVVQIDQLCVRVHPSLSPEHVRAVAVRSAEDAINGPGSLAPDAIAAVRTSLERQRQELERQRERHRATLRNATDDLRKSGSLYAATHGPGVLDEDDQVWRDYDDARRYAARDRVREILAIDLDTDECTPSLPPSELITPELYETARAHLDTIERRKKEREQAAKQEREDARKRSGAALLRWITDRLTDDGKRSLAEGYPTGELSALLDCRVTEQLALALAGNESTKNCAVIERWAEHGDRKLPNQAAWDLHDALVAAVKDLDLPEGYSAEVSRILSLTEYEKITASDPRWDKADGDGDIAHKRTGVVVTVLDQLGAEVTQVCFVTEGRR